METENESSDMSCFFAFSYKNTKQIICIITTFFWNYSGKKYFNHAEHSTLCALVRKSWTEYSFRWRLQPGLYTWSNFDQSQQCNHLVNHWGVYYWQQLTCYNALGVGDFFPGTHFQGCRTKTPLIQLITLSRNGSRIIENCLILRSSIWIYIVLTDVSSKCTWNVLVSFH